MVRLMLAAVADPDRDASPISIQQFLLMKILPVTNLLNSFTGSMLNIVKTTANIEILKYSIARFFDKLL